MLAYPAPTDPKAGAMKALEKDPCAQKENTRYTKEDTTHHAEPSEAMPKHGLSFFRDPLGYGCFQQFGVFWLVSLCFEPNLFWGLYLCPIGRFGCRQAPPIPPPQTTAAATKPVEALDLVLELLFLRHLEKEETDRFGVL